MARLSRKHSEFILSGVTTPRRYLPLVLCAVLLAGCFGTARPPVPPPPAAPLVEPPVQPERWIRVRKTERTLTLYAGTQPVKTYPVVLGKDPVWAKLYAGDKRTPEGEYHVTKKYFHPFWSRFMLLDYPTARNRELYAWSRAKRLLPERGRHVPAIGGAVGIHGTEDERLNRRGVNWTAGCVSLFNRDVEELYDLVEVGTRVVIER